MNTVPVIQIKFIFLFFFIFIFYRKSLICQLLTGCLDQTVWEMKSCCWQFGCGAVAGYPQMRAVGAGIALHREQLPSTMPSWHGFCPWWVHAVTVHNRSFCVTKEVLFPPVKRFLKLPVSNSCRTAQQRGGDVLTCPKISKSSSSWTTPVFYKEHGAKSKIKKKCFHFLFLFFYSGELN